MRFDWLVLLAEILRFSWEDAGRVALLLFLLLGVQHTPVCHKQIDMAEQDASPAAWTVEQVESWALSVKLSPTTVSILVENEIDGATLVTLTRDDLRNELGIRSLPARRYLWEVLLSLQSKQTTSDHAVAIEAYAEEIGTFATEPADKSAGGSELPSSLIDVLKSDVDNHRQILEDHLYCLRLQQNESRSQQVFEDMDTARQEQLRFDRQFIQSEFDRSFAATVGSRRPMGQQQDAGVKSLFSLCIELCVKNSINVSEALSSGRIQPVLPLQDNEDSLNRPATSLSRSTENADTSDVLDNKEIVLIDCNVCLESEQPGFSFACGHPYCFNCARDYMKAALRDSTLLPLRCCDIPLDARLPFLVVDDHDAKVLQDRSEEIQAVNKMYCPSCNRFINLDSFDFSGLCVCDCGAELCLSCRSAAHPLFTCEQNKAAIGTDNNESLLALAQELGWKQCPNCSIMIEFITGCNHMECTACRHHFCFQCLSSWDKANTRCSSRRCELWEEDRLLEAGEARVRAMEANQGIALPVAQRGRYVQNAMDALRVNEVCNHQWERHNLTGTCENCGYVLWVYGMVCQSECQSTVCYTCAHHRIPQRGWR